MGLDARRGAARGGRGGEPRHPGRHRGPGPADARRPEGPARPRALSPPMAGHRRRPARRASPAGLRAPVRHRGPARHRARRRRGVAGHHGPRAPLVEDRDGAVRRAHRVRRRRHVHGPDDRPPRLPVGRHRAHLRRGRGTHRRPRGDPLDRARRGLDRAPQAPDPLSGELPSRGAGGGADPAVGPRPRRLRGAAGSHPAAACGCWNDSPACTCRPRGGPAHQLQPWGHAPAGRAVAAGGLEPGLRAGLVRRRGGPAPPHDAGLRLARVPRAGAPLLRRRAGPARDPLRARRAARPPAGEPRDPRVRGPGAARGRVRALRPAVRRLHRHHRGRVQLRHHPGRLAVARRDAHGRVRRRPHQRQGSQGHRPLHPRGPRHVRGDDRLRPPSRRTGRPRGSQRFLPATAAPAASAPPAGDGASCRVSAPPAVSAPLYGADSNPVPADRYRRPERTIAPRPSHVAASQSSPPTQGISNSR